MNMQMYKMIDYLLTCSILLLFLFLLFILNYRFIKSARIVRRLFKTNILQNKEFSWQEIREHFSGRELLEIQAGMIKPNTFYKEFQNKFMISLTEADESDFARWFLNQKVKAKLLLRIDNSWFIGIYDFEYVLGLFLVPEDNKEQYARLMREYFVLYEKDMEKREKRIQSKSSLTNFGTCPKCLNKISMFARKCPYCTADLE